MSGGHSLWMLSTDIWWGCEIDTPMWGLHSRLIWGEISKKTDKCEWSEI